MKDLKAALDDMFFKWKEGMPKPEVEVYAFNLNDEWDTILYYNSIESNDSKSGESELDEAEFDG